VAAAKATRTDVSKIKFVLGSEIYHHQDEYWETVLDVAKHTTLSRMQRSTTIMGRREGEQMDFAKLIYPAMQVADIYFQKLTLMHAGMDQRKAHVIAREVAHKLQYHSISHQGETFSPIALHQHLVLGLQKPPVWPIPPGKKREVQSEAKMSKSVQGSAIFLDDSEEEIRKKLAQAFCMEKEISYNPVLDWAKHLVFPFTDALAIERPAKFGGNITYPAYASLEADFASGKLHPMDLKNGVAEALIAILAPARRHLTSSHSLKLKEEFLQLKVTR
ncbi:MAG: tyrosine--tRNA ligase, partial [archaeon]|nr:tyrosine--tRNA ligase [archaeon]